MEITQAKLNWRGPLTPITQKIEKIICHHPASTGTMEANHRFHRETRGWNGLGYSYWVDYDGSIFEVRGRNVGAHSGSNWNDRSYGICFRGNFEVEQMRDQQVEAGAWLCAKLLREESLSMDDIVGHNKVAATLCPGRNFRMRELKERAAKLLEGTKIVGPTEATMQRAQEWARARGAHQRFIDVAPVYWRYGELTGIRPEVLYAQSAKETAFGRYGGVVSPEMNNWAGIKTRQGGPCDERSAHESFATPEDGVRAHFNHMSAYVGIEPIGIPHGRYHVVMRLGLAGTVRHLEELGGRWAPAKDYGTSIVNDYLVPLLATPAEPKTRKIYRVQFGAFRNRALAEVQAQEARKRGFAGAFVREEVEQ